MVDETFAFAAAFADSVGLIVCVRSVGGGDRQLAGKETVRSITDVWQPRRPEG
ncbi:hypothetical protein [Streptomyces mirabilis]|uniref:hypothetical protein n=1 Tax=Streptomyces mirabilis TaxID=68239 RepID=UPI00365B0D05